MLLLSRVGFDIVGSSTWSRPVYFYWWFVTTHFPSIATITTKFTNEEEGLSARINSISYDYGNSCGSSAGVLAGSGSCLTTFHKKLPMEYKPAATNLSRNGLPNSFRM